jgi:hypothetical protein
MAKSAKHIELQRMCLIWLEGLATQRGIRGCEEVIIDCAYVADAAAISGLQYGNKKKFGASAEVEDFTFVFEAKVSRADYLSTFRKSDGNRMTAKANFHFIVAAKGVVAPEEVPEMWGLLVESGRGLGLRKVPKYMHHETDRLHEFAYKLLRSGHNNKFTYNIECKPIKYPGSDLLWNQKIQTPQP